MKNCSREGLSFSSLSGMRIEGEFSAESVSSNGGVLLLREIDRKLKLTQRLAALLPDKRDQNAIDHSLSSMLCQRIFGLALGYEDLNDHTLLRKDDCLKTGSNSLKDLASSSTLSRFENSLSKKDIRKIDGLLLDLFIERHRKKPPREFVLDFDATDFLIHGNQEGRYYNSYYENDCFLPLYVFCGDDLVSVLLRSSDRDGAHHTWAVLSLLVRRIRQEFPGTKIIFRADGGFCRDRMLRWCDKQGVFYIVGMAKNNRLMKAVKKKIAKARKEYEATGLPVRLYDKFEYAADTWKCKRTMVARIEYNHHGENVRFITTNIKGHCPTLYAGIYCRRGDMENRIKQQKLDLKADRISASSFIANSFRVLLSGFAYVLLTHLKTNYLKKSEFKNAYASTIRTHLLKIGAVIKRSASKIKIMFDAHFPHQELFASLLKKMHPA